MILLKFLWNLEDPANSDSWDLLYKLLRSKERPKMIAARLYIYFPYGEISNKKRNLYSSDVFYFTNYPKNIYISI